MQEIDIFSLVEQYEKEIFRDGDITEKSYYKSEKCDLLLDNVTKKMKKCTFIMALKSRSKRAINSIISIVTELTYKDFDFIIVEDIYESDDILEIPSEYSSFITHLKVDTKLKWNKSVLMNIGIKNSLTECFVMWDADFIFTENFRKKFTEVIKKVLVRELVISIPSFETHESYNIGVLYKEKESYGGLWVIPKRAAIEAEWFNENINGWGFEETDLIKRIVPMFIKNKLMLSYYYDIIVFHHSHSDEMRVFIEDNSKFIK